MLFNIYRQHLTVTLLGFSVFVSRSTSGSIYILSLWTIIHYHFRFHYNQSDNLIETGTIIFLHIYFLPVQSSASGCCVTFAWFSGNFSLVLLIKMLLIKKACIPRCTLRPWLSLIQALCHKINLTTYAGIFNSFMVLRIFITILLWRGEEIKVCYSS